MKMRRMVAGLFALCVLLAGCSQEGSSSQADDFAAGTTTYQVDDLQFEVPNAWLEDVQEDGAYYYFYPHTKYDGTEFLMIQFSNLLTEESITSEEAFGGYVDGIVGSADDYQEDHKEIATNRNGEKYGRLDYTFTVSDAPVRVVSGIFDSAHGTVAFALASDSDIHYLEEFLQIIDSVQIVADGDASTDREVILADQIPDEPVSEPEAQEEPEAEPDPEPETPSMTTGQYNALKTANRYLDVLPFSYTGLIEQLEYEGYSHEEAVYGADNCGADWYEQALLQAESYLDTMPFSYTGLIEQLEYEGFTHAEAVYGADNCGADWYEQAVLQAERYLELMSFSRQGLIDQLLYEGFTQDQAVYGAEQNGY